MTAEAAHSALRRKARANHSSVGPTAMDAKKAIRVAMARAGDTALDIAVGVRKIEIDPVMPDGLSDAPIEDALLLRLKDAQGARGLIMLCQQTVAAIIEASTLGTVFASEAETRAPTETDAVLARSFFDQFFVLFGHLAAEMAHPPPVSGYTATETIEDLRVAQMGLADAAHKRYRITLDFGLGAKVGQVIFVLPAQRDAPAEQSDESVDWGDALHRAVMGTEAFIEAQLCTVRLSLAEVTNLKVGDVVPLPGSSIDGISLIGPTGKKVSGARLGRAGPIRAVRVQLVDEDSEANGTETDAFGVGDVPGDLPALGVAPAPAAPLSLPPADDIGFDTPSFDPGGIDAAPIDGMAMDAAPLDMDFGGDFNPGDGALGAIDPIQIPADQAKTG